MPRRPAHIPDGKKCHAHSKTTKKPCGSWALQGQDVCRMHGGGSKASRAAAQKRIAEAGAEAHLVRLRDLYGAAEPVTNPLAEMAQLAGEAKRLKDIVGNWLAEMTQESIRYQDLKGSEQLRSEVALYERALDRCNAILSSYARLKIDERLSAIEEAKAKRVLAAIDAALDAVGVPPERRGDAKKVAARHLRAV